jgi:cytochrome c oxidase subunit 3
MTPTQDKYFIPHVAHWPIVLSIGLFLLFAGLSVLLNGGDLGKWVAFAGMAIVLIMIFRWLSQVIGESEGGTYNPQVDMSFRMGMGWFIFSEVMFFACFFGVLWYTRNLTLPWLGGQGNNFFTNQLIWQGFENEWPSNGPGNIGGKFLQMSAWGIPAINTAILLTSGVTLTVAHHALKDNNRTRLNMFLALTFLLGFVFIGLQAKEYIDAYQELGLTLGSGIYGSTFFLLTGFHGLHVTLGVIMLVVVWLRCMKGHFKPERHFAFEGVAWYWHFVDVVWLILFIFVYWL